MIPQAELDRWKQLCAKATEGPWTTSFPWLSPEMQEESKDDFWHFSVFIDTKDTNKHLPVCMTACMTAIEKSPERDSEADADFIAAARTALPRLIAEVEEGRQHLEIILPMAIAYAHISPVGNNCEMVEAARRFLGEEGK